jgi:hypothetical protein
MLGETNGISRRLDMIEPSPRQTLETGLQQSQANPDNPGQIRADGLLQDRQVQELTVNSVDQVNTSP